MLSLQEHTHTHEYTHTQTHRQHRYTHMHVDTKQVSGREGTLSEVFLDQEMLLGSVF